MLLQIMEEGRLTDNVGRTIDFKNTILIMTTNIGAGEIIAKEGFGLERMIKRDTEASYEDMKRKLKGAMEKEFRPEFLNRLDDIIVFRSLTKDDLKAIVNMELAKVEKRLKDKGLKLIVTDEAKDFLIDKGSSLEFGARPLRRAIEQHMEDMLAEELLKGTFHNSDTISVRVAEGEGEKKLTFDATKTEEPPALEPVGAGAGEAK